MAFPSISLSLCLRIKRKAAMVLLPPSLFPPLASLAPHRSSVRLAPHRSSVRLAPHIRYALIYREDDADEARIAREERELDHKARSAHSNQRGGNLARH